MQLGTLTFCLAPVVIVTFLVMLNARLRWRLTISKRRLLVVRCGFRDTTMEILATAVEEVSLRSIKKLAGGRNLHFVQGKLPIIGLADSGQIVIAGNTSKTEAR